MSRGRVKIAHTVRSTIRCANTKCSNKHDNHIKQRLVDEAQARGDDRPLFCYRCSHPHRSSNAVPKDVAEQGVKVMRMGEDTIA